MGYEKKKRNDACPKKVCHMLLKRHVKNRKDAYPKKVRHMLIRHVKINIYMCIAHVHEK